MIRENHAVTFSHVLTEVVQTIVNQHYVIEVIEHQDATIAHDLSDANEQLQICFEVKVGFNATHDLRIDSNESIDIEYTDSFICDTLAEALEVAHNAVVSVCEAVNA